MDVQKSFEDANIDKVYSIDKKTNSVVVYLNPRLFSQEVIYSALYALLDKIWFIVDGDPRSQIIVEMRPKEKGIELESLVFQFYEELINYSYYNFMSQHTKEIREILMRRVFLSQMGESQDFSNPLSCDLPPSNEYVDGSEDDFNLEFSVPSDDSVEFWDDPLGIAKPWSPEDAKGLEDISLEVDSDENKN